MQKVGKYERHGLSISRRSSGKRSKTVGVVVHGSTRFYSPEEVLAKTLKENLSRELSVQPVKKIDHSKMTPEQIDNRLLLAMSLLRKYYACSPFLRSVRYSSRRRRLTEKQIEAVINFCEKIKKEEMKIDEGASCPA